uniref:Uncharacterized protein n=1 Tax=Romanomermis culicivorax TaxID=13658 RepID=A0A915JFZ5_ROMCU
MDFADFIIDLYYYRCKQMYICDVLYRGVLGDGEFDGCSHVTPKNYPMCKQAYFSDFLVEGVFNRESRSELLGAMAPNWPKKNLHATQKIIPNSLLN